MYLGDVLIEINMWVLFKGDVVVFGVDGLIWFELVSIGKSIWIVVCDVYWKENYCIFGKGYVLIFVIFGNLVEGS